MENLGKIDININDSYGGGGGGGGGDGGGGGGQAGQGPNVSAKTTMTADRLFDMVDSASAAMSTVSNYLSNPSFGGFMQITRMLTQAGTQLASLGAVGAAATAVLLPAALGLAAGAGLVVVALNGLKSAAEAITTRISEVFRFSGVLSMAVAQERLAQFQRQLREATVNGRLYAQAQMWATRASNATAENMMEFNRLLAVGATIWNRLVVGFNNMLRPLAKMAGNLADISAIALGNISVVTSLLDRYFGTGFFTWVKDAITAVLEFLGLIVDNTKPAVLGNPNNWFLDDVQAMTGNSYDRIGRTPSGKAAWRANDPTIPQTVPSGRIPLPHRGRARN